MANEGFSTLIFMLNNLSIFIVLVIGYGVLTDRLGPKPASLRLPLLGIFFGVIAVACMHAKIQVWEGVIVDQRNSVVALGAFFGGPIVAGISGVMAAGYRFYLGGQGAFAGMIGVIIAATLGTLLHYLAGMKTPSPLRIGIGSAIIAIGLLPGFLLVGDLATGWALLKKVAIPFGLATFTGMFIGGLLLAWENRRQLSEAERAQSEEQFRILFETSEVAVFSLDMTETLDWISDLRSRGWEDLESHLANQNGKLPDLARAVHVLDVNKAALRLLKNSSKEECPRNWEALFGDSSDDLLLQVLRAIWWEAPNFRVETSLVTPTGESIRVVLSLPIPADRDQARNVPLTLLDITERARAEEQRDEALREAERANEAKTEFLATMSHELRTPLNAILGFSDVLTSQYFGPPGAGKYKEYASYIHRSGRMLLDLVDDLLDIAAIEAGKRTLNLDSVDLSHIVAESSLMVKQAADRSGLDLIYALPGDLPPVQADERAIKQVLLNLMSNAIRNTESGGRVHVSATVDGRFVDIVVSDSGRGIPAELLDRVARPFFRREQDPHKADEGWGLGLAIAKSLTELHNGQFQISSQVGEGTVITVRLPHQIGLPN